MELSGRRITVGVAGGIAAYKAAELVRLLVKQGAVVQVVMTPAAERFITRLTLQALSGREVAVEMFDLDRESRIGHIEIGDRAELLVIAPATADLIARLAAGMADDLLATVALATRAPLLLAPAMNVNMWRHPATRGNLAVLAARGVRFVGPDAGELACGWIGEGRLIEPPVIVEACARALQDADAARRPRDLEGRRVLVTAGPTHEPIDPVRFLGNRSSGKMGFALAAAAAARGADVVLIAGPVALLTPEGVTRVDVRTAAEMHAAVLTREAEMDVVIKAAAVADHRPDREASEKIKKGDADHATLSLVRNPDILGELVRRRDARSGRRPYLVGFAAETGALVERAAAKLAEKGCDLLVANDVSEPGIGFGSDENHVVLLAPGVAPTDVPRASKDRIAGAVLDRIVAALPSPLPAPSPPPPTSSTPRA